MRRKNSPASDCYISRIRANAWIDGINAGHIDAYLADFEAIHAGDALSKIYYIPQIVDLYERVFKESTAKIYKANQAKRFSASFKRAYKQVFGDTGLAVGDEWRLKVLYVATLEVNRGLRRQGVGAALMKAITKLKHKADIVVLMAYPLNAKEETADQRDELVSFDDYRKSPEFLSEFLKLENGISRFYQSIGMTEWLPGHHRWFVSKAN